MSEQVFCYLPLNPPTSIRLLRIRSELNSGHVSCILEQFADKIPPYSALSYFWGDPKRTRQIYLGNKLIGIHETLWEFLDQTWRSHNTETWFWTDFLCLNQDDNTEMSQQVQRMGAIYAEAKQTLSWLGREGSPAAIGIKDSKPVMNLGRSLEIIVERVSLKRKAVEEFFADLPSWTTIMHYRSCNMNLDELNLRKSSKEVQQLGYGQSGQPLLDVLSLPYWTRVWIVQEVAIGNVVKLVFGSVSIDFDDFFLAYKCHFYHQVTTAFIPLHGEIKSGTKVPIQARAAVIDKNLSMHQVLQWGRLCDSSRSIDRIYGLFGLLRFHEAGASPTVHSLTVDYDKNVASTFWDVIFACRVSRKRVRPTEPLQDHFLRKQVSEFTELLPLVAESLGCSFSPESLLLYSNSVEPPPLDKDMTRLTNRMLSVFRAVGKGFTAAGGSKCWRPTRFPARLLAARQWRSFEDLELDLATLFLECAQRDGFDEYGEVHAALIAVRLAKSEDLASGEGGWKIFRDQPEGSEQSFDDAKNKVEFLVRWQHTAPALSTDTLASCYLADRATRLVGPKHHRCHGSSLFLDLPDPGWKFKLDLKQNNPEGWMYGVLSITVSGPLST